MGRGYYAGRRGASREAETSAAFWAAVNGHLAAMVARDLAHEGQTQPGTLLAGREEWREDRVP